jgi:RNA polymerase I-specific transcription initiation factor RRN3
MCTQGNNESYDVLVDQFNIKKAAFDTPSPIPQLRQWLHALMHVVSRLDRSHMALIEAITRFPWMTMDSNLVKTYTSFMEILVSARPEYLSLVLGRVAQGFTYRASSQYRIGSVADSILVFVCSGNFFRIGTASS